MAEKAKIAQREKGTTNKRTCPICPAEIRVARFAGYGKKGFYWTCDKDGCDYTQPTH